MWKVSLASARRPSPSKRSGLVRSTSSMTLSGCTVEDRTGGRWPSSVNSRCERNRVSWWKRPVGLCSSATTSPYSSNMAKLSPCLSVRRLEAASETTPGTSTGPPAGCASRFTPRASHGRQRAAPAERAVDGKVVARHAFGREALLEALAHAGAVEPDRLVEHGERRVQRVAQEAGQPRFDDIGHVAL